LFRTRSAAIFGIEAQTIEVEVDLYPSSSQSINGGAIIDHDPPRERWLVAVEK
jgi:hypothetical protein